MQEVPKRIRRLVREWAGIAHDRELRKTLSELRGQFDRWERGEIDSFELNELVQQIAGLVEFYEHDLSTS